MSRVLWIGLVVGLAWNTVGESAPGARWRLFSRSTAGLHAVINGVPGRLELAHFRCPLSLHVATCGATLFLGDPVLFNLFAHGSLKAMEFVNWADFQPNEHSEQARALRRLLRDPAYNAELYRIVELHLAEYHRRVEGAAGAAARLRSGTVELSLYSHAEKQIPYPRQTGRVWVSSPRVDIHTSRLLFQSAHDGLFYEGEFVAEGPWKLTTHNPFCGELLRWEG